MILLFRLLGTATFLYLDVFGGYIALVEVVALLRLSGVSGSDLLIILLRTWLTPFAGLVLTVVCFGIAEAFAELHAVRYSMRYKKYPRAAQNVNYHIHVAGEDPPHGIRAASARGPRTLPGRNVPMREIPLPEQRRRNWVLPGRPHQETRIRTEYRDPDERFKPKR